MNVAARPYNVLGLCAGVGGLELGVRIARPGARGVCYLEREVPAAARLAARMLDGSLHPAPVWSDLTTFDGRPWRGVVDCLTSGDPCQPNSVAGKQRGKDDDRWLLDHVFRIIDEVRPDRVFRENVPGNADGQLAAIVPALEGMGYRVAAGIFSARGAGASHLRERLFIMADANGRHAGAEREQRGGQQRFLAEGDGDHRIDLADANGDGSPSLSRDAGEVRGLQEAQRQPEHGAALPRRGSEGLGNTIGRGDDWQSAEPRRGTLVGTAADGAGHSGIGLAYTGGAGLQGLWPCGDAQGRQDPDGHAGLEGRARLLFAPGPDDPAWVQIIGSAPHLAPAVADVDVAQALFSEGVGPEGVAAQAQSVLRRLDAWLAQRVDRLRAGGNGVSPLAAALAWRTLGASLEYDRRRSVEPLRLRSAA